MTIRQKKYIDITGERFGNLTVISKSVLRGKNCGHMQWDCQCDCGNISTVRGYDLRSGATKSCGHGCDYSGKFKYTDRYYAKMKCVYSTSVVHRSKKLNLDYNLSLDEYLEFTNDPCYYCGNIGSNTTYDKRTSNGIETIRTNIHFNGIDRIDNDIGYMKDNCVTCCKHCNNAKRTMSQEDFLLHIKQIYDYSQDTIFKLAN